MPAQPKAQALLYPKIKHTPTVSYPSLTALDKKFSHHRGPEMSMTEFIAEVLSLSLSTVIQSLRHDYSYSPPCCACGCVQTSRPPILTEALEMLFVLLIGFPSPVVTPARSTFPDQIYLP